MSEAKSTGGPRARSIGLAVLAWLVPGSGHWMLGRRRRALLFMGIVAASMLLGCALEGNLYRVAEGRPLTLLGTLASAGTGLVYGLLRFVVGYRGDILSRGYEYGTAFLVTAGLMNWLLVLDVWDRARGTRSEAAGEPTE